MRLTDDQAWCLQWVAAVYPGSFRDVSVSTSMNALVRKGLATKGPAPGVRQHRFKQCRLTDFRLTSDGMKELSLVNYKLWILVSDRVTEACQEPV